MASAYPGAYDDFSISGNPVRNDLVARLSNLYDAVEAVQHELGLSPSSSYATVLARLDAMQQQITDLETTVGDAVATAMDAHTDNLDPHSGSYGKIVTPQKPDGGGKIFIAGSPSATGTENDAWIDTAS